MIWISLALAADPMLESRAQPTPPAPELVDFVALFQTRGSASNVIGTSALGDGQLVGRLGGLNGTQVVDGERSVGVEQRVGAFVGYRPLILDGRAGLNAAFEVDFAWGDASYGSGGNAGGGFGADYVNLQTRRLYADFRPTSAVHVLVGLQLLTDSVLDPTASTPDQLWRSGGRMTVLGSEAAGVAVYGHSEPVRWRAGAFTLVEGSFGVNDDIGLLVLDAQIEPAAATTVGLHAWHLRDRAKGVGGPLGSGPTSLLSGLQGGPQLASPAATDADLSWLALDAGYNPLLTHGRGGVHGVALANLGRLYVQDGFEDRDVRGWMLDVEGRFRWAEGRGSLVRAELLMASGDDPETAAYEGLVTANSYGVVGAVWATHGCVLLHPDPLSINRMTAQWPDVSAGGRGMTALSATVAWDAVPDRLNLALTAGTALLPDESAQEINLRLTAEPMLLVNTSLVGAWLARPDEDAWLVLATLDWLVI